MNASLGESSINSAHDSRRIGRQTASIISFSAGSMIARASSGSRSSISSIDPLMSANNAVTVLRSPSSRSPAGCSGAMRISGAVDAT